MKLKCIFLCIGLSLTWVMQSQDSTFIDNKYREDQFYATITYNVLNQRPSGISQNGFSPGFHLGFIRDMPINKQRNLALGLGLGLSINSYNQDLLIEATNNKYSYTAIPSIDENVTRNRFSNYLVELPFELRWRTSTATDYNFWRIYLGFKLGYLLYNNSNFLSDERQITLSNIDDFNTFQSGLTLSAGYATWNFYAYYGLNPLFNNNAIINNQRINMRFIKIGLMFYIL